MKSRTLLDMRTVTALFLFLLSGCNSSYLVWETLSMEVDQEVS